MIRTRLMPHQLTAVKFALDKKHVAIFSDYGTGKTLMFLALCDVLKLRRVLVVSTKTSVQSTWPDEIRQHTNHLFVTLIGSVRKKLLKIHQAVRIATTAPNPNLKPRTIHFLVNYDGVRNIAKELAALKFDMIVCDESTKIKSPRASRSKMLWALAPTARRQCILTGFPITEGLHELYSQVKFLDSGEALGKSYWSFINSCFVRPGGHKIVPKRRAIPYILKQIAPFSIRITNKELQLPPKQYKILRVDQTPQQAQYLKALNETFRLELGRVQIDVQYIFTLLQKSMQICDGFVLDTKSGRLEPVHTNKDVALLEELNEIDLRQNKVVIWSAWRFSVAKIAQIMKKVGVPALTLEGNTKDPGNVVKVFQANNKYRVLICTLAKAAESITLTSSRVAIYYSNGWSYDRRSNSEARIRRKGSEKHTNIQYVDMLTEGTVERQVYDCLRKKGNLVKNLQDAFLSMDGTHTNNAQQI